MSLNYGYFDSIDGDRKYDADTMSKYFLGIISRGVLQTYGGGLQVTEMVESTETEGEEVLDEDLELAEEGSLPVTLQTGKAYFSNGKWVENTAAYTVILGRPSMTLPRIDRIVLRCDTTDEGRDVTVLVKEGIPDNDPVVPELVSNEYIEEMSLCQIYVEPETTKITQDKITDERPNDEVCGFVHQLFDQVSTEELFSQYDAAFEEWFSETKETLATTTLIRQYSSSYITAVQDQTEIPINIAQFSSDVDILNVYINGLKLIKDLDYTRQDSNIVLVKPVDINTKIEIEVLKSVDGSDAITVVEQVENLQLEIEELETYNYYCNGTNDNKSLTELCQSFIENKGTFNTHNKLTINVIGYFGIDTSILYDGEEGKTYSLAIVNTSEKQLCLDFSNCDLITAKGAFMYAQNATIKNLSVKHKNDVLDVDIYTLSGFKSVFDSCKITGSYSGGTCTAMYLNQSRALNCDINVTSNGVIYGFNGDNLILDDCEAIVESSSSSAYGVSSTTTRASNCNFLGNTESTATDASGNGGIGGGSFNNCLFEGFGGLKGHGFYLRASNTALMSNCVFRGYTKDSTSGTAVGFTTAPNEGNTMFLHGINCNQIAVDGYSQLASMNITNGYGAYSGLFYTTPTIYNAENVVSHGAFNRNR